MKVALGLKAHSGWAALVALGMEGGRPRVAERRRLELAPAGEAWAKQPYHAAERLGAPAARDLVERGIASARQCALREIRAAVRRLVAAGHDPAAGAVLTTAPMPDWSVEEILAVHFRMHKAEGALFRDVLARGAEACGLLVLEIPEKRLAAQAARALGRSEEALQDILASLRKEVGPPWGKDQKDAALAAWVALRS